MTDQTQKQTLMANICAALAQTLQSANTDNLNALSRQAKMLDDLLVAVMRTNLQSTVQYGNFDERSLNMALRIQKQCIDTLKAASAIDYMNALNAPKMAPPLPPPPKMVEQSEGEA